MTTDERGNLLCETCGARPAMRHTLSLLGPLDVREDRQCVACQEASDARMSPVAEDDFAHLGPIDFAVLRRSMLRAECEGMESPGALAFAASRLEEIAAAHGQGLPLDVRAFIARHPC